MPGDTAVHSQPTRTAHIQQEKKQHVMSYAYVYYISLTESS